MMAPPTGKSKHFVRWEEEYVSNDRGSRVVHYYLRDRHGNARLAVVGTEKSLRHMVYVVSNEFLHLLSNNKSMSSSSSTSSSSPSGSMKWRSRREVVDWLSSLLSRPRSAASSGDHSASPQKTWLCLCCRGYCLEQSTKRIIWTILISNPALLRKLWSDREYLVQRMEVDT